MRVCIVIPAYEPGGEFVPYAQEVLAAGLGPVLVVDDGSGPAYAPVFAALAEMADAGLLRVEDRQIVVLPPGRMLIRAISMVFDRRLRADRENKRYSKVI